MPEQKVYENFHPIGAGALFTGKVHPKVIHKIHELIADGLLVFKKSRKHLLIPEFQIKPDEANRTYFPTTTDIQNHVYSAQKLLELSRLDQENLRLKINEWKKEAPNCN